MRRLLRRLLFAAKSGIQSKLKPAGSEPPKLIFVLGTGRSGTHFLTRCLIGNRCITDLTGGKENPLVFDQVTAAALDPRNTPAMLDRVEQIYVSLARLAAPKWLVDQSHPNIWFADRWAEVFSKAVFVGIIRNPYSVVASMLKHRNVLRWVETWQRYPVPNRFLGITEDNAAEYAGMSLAERCAVRWVAHYARMQQLRPLLGNRLHVISYEDLCANPEACLAPISQAFGVDGAFDLPEVNRASLTKAEALSAEDVARIAAVLKGARLDAPWTKPLWLQPDAHSHATALQCPGRQPVDVPLADSRG